MYFYFFLIVTPTDKKPHKTLTKKPQNAQTRSYRPTHPSSFFQKDDHTKQDTQKKTYTNVSLSFSVSLLVFFNSIDLSLSLYLFVSARERFHSLPLSFSCFCAFSRSCKHACTLFQRERERHTHTHTHIHTYTHTHIHTHIHMHAGTLQDQVK